MAETGAGSCLASQPGEVVTDEASKKKSIHICMYYYRHYVDFVVHDDKSGLCCCLWFVLGYFLFVLLCGDASLIIAFHITVVCLCPLSGNMGW